MIDPTLDAHRFSIGNTPMTDLAYTSRTGVPHVIHIKEERCNQFGSIKDRVAFYLLSKWHAAGRLEPRVVDASSGNYGFALASIGQVLGLDVTIVSSGSITDYNRRGIQRTGADLIIATPRPGESSNAARMRVAGDVAKAQGASFLNQYESPANPESHQCWTAVETFGARTFDACFLAASSGGTASGIFAYLESAGLQTELVIAEPTGSRAFQDPGDPKAAKPCIPGYGSGRRSSFAVSGPRLNVSRVDEKAVQLAFELWDMETWPPIGASSVGTVLAAMDWLDRADTPRQVVCICADGRERYTTGRTMDRPVCETVDTRLQDQVSAEFTRLEAV